MTNQAIRRWRFHLSRAAHRPKGPMTPPTRRSAQDASRMTVLRMPEMKWFNAGVICRAMSVSEKDVLAAMSTVMDPELNIDLVRAGMVKDLRIEGDKVRMKIELTPPACPLKGKIQADAEA